MKELLATQEGFPAKYQRWLYNGKELSDQMAVGHCDDSPWFLGEGVVKVVMPSYAYDLSWDHLLILAMGTHVRLGARSWLRQLTTDNLRMICTGAVLDESAAETSAAAAPDLATPAAVAGQQDGSAGAACSAEAHGGVSAPADAAGAVNYRPVSYLPKLIIKPVKLGFSKLRSALTN
jgi:hypothetical protein